MRRNPYRGRLPGTAYALSFFMLTALILWPAPGRASTSQPSCRLAVEGSLHFGAIVAGLPRDSESGRTIASRTLSYVMSCEHLTPGHVVAVKFRPDRANCSPRGDPVYLGSSTMPAIGLRFRLGATPDADNAVAICTHAINEGFFDVWSGPATASTQSFRFALGVDVVKTHGALRAGSTAFSTLLGHLSWVQLGTTSERTFATTDGTLVSTSMTLRVRPQTCRTSDVNVVMGNITTARLARIGAQAGPWQRFHIDVDNCPAGLQLVRYRLDHVAPLMNHFHQVLSPGQGGNAAVGVGVQLGHPNGGIFFFARTFTAHGYESVRASGGHFRIPLQARYFKPARAAAIRAGTVRAQALLTMSYQ